ncbi:potassium/proton antiporter [Saccharospirillum sp.]|uniref:potassium/proton antiporter n=1 Tax=Saccharospirillum sp. TaxID=2033801 RepID=UPI0034A0217C
MVDTNTFLLIAGLLLLIGIIASSLTVRLGLPFLLLFLGVGMLAGEDGVGGIPFDNFDLAFLVGNLALAVILLDGGMRTKRSTFRAALWPSVTLATAGVILTATGVGLFATWLLGVDLRYGLLLGAIVGSTDAAAVFNLLRNSGIRLNERVGGTLEIESGANDPMAILLVVIMIELLTGSAQFTPGALLQLVLLQFLLGGLIGVFGGWVLVGLLKRLHLAEGLYAILIVSFGLVVFAGVNRLGGSGFLAVYLLGLVVGNAKTKPPESVSQIMDGLAWLSQAGMFLILGLLVSPANMFENALAAVSIAAFLMLFARPLAVILCLLPFRFRWQERWYISWVGLRGAVPIILAVYPVMSGLENSQLLFDITFAVVLVSLLIQGSTVPVVARLLNVLIPAPPAPTNRHPLLNEADLSLEVDEFVVQPNAPVLSPFFNANQNDSANPQCVALIRDKRPMDVDGAIKFKAGDRVWMLLHSEDVDDVAAQFSGQKQQGMLTAQNFYGEFVIRPEALVDDLVKSYGIAMAPAEQRLTVAELLQQRLGKHPVEGDRIRLGGLRLTIRQMDGDTILAIGLKLGSHKNPQ